MKMKHLEKIILRYCKVIIEKSSQQKAPREEFSECVPTQRRIGSLYSYYSYHRKYTDCVGEEHNALPLFSSASVSVHSNTSISHPLVRGIYT